MIKYYDTTESALSSKAFEAEALYYCTDSGRIYVDSLRSQERVEAGNSIIILSTESSRSSLLAPIPNRLYCVLETGMLYIYSDSVWKSLGSRPQIHIKNVTVSNGTLTREDARILASDTAVFIPDLSVEDLVTSCSASCQAGKVVVTLSPTTYDIMGEIIIN